MILGPCFIRGIHQRGTEIDDASGKCTDNKYFLIAMKGLVLGGVGLEDTEGEGEAYAGGQ